ncbi:hypothetical protein L0337_05695 [candidate division KSB1 bacterium]|nr:hypothetical protein [candidate division KSB1 bacterium]
MSLMEPDVALTDYGLTIECAVIAMLLYKQGRRGNAMRFWFVTLFAALGFGAFLGGTEHGFIEDKTSGLHGLVWSATLISIGVAGVAAWAIGARLLFSGRVVRCITSAAVILFGIYSAIVLWLIRDFWIALVHYLPASAFLLAAFLLEYRRTLSRYFGAGVAGLGLTIVAATVQQAGFGLHPKYFNYNALYHLIQAFAFLLIYHCARGLLAARSGREHVDAS